MNNLPLTNKHLFTPIQHGAFELVEATKNEEYVWGLDKKYTEHILIINNNTEGIRIIWEGNPFGLINDDGGTLEYRREF